MEQYKAARLAEPVTLPVTKERRVTPPARPPKLTSPATVNREIAILARMGSLARRQYGLAVPFVVEKLKERNAREGFFEEGAFRAVCRLLRPELAALATVGQLTGWRKSELRSREWRHCDFGAGWLRLEPEETKNREGRMFPLIPELRAVREAQRTRREALQKATGQVIPWVFCRDDGARSATSRRRGRRHGSRLACRGDCFTTSGGRRSATWIRAGIPETVAMKLTGHRTRAVFQRYAIVEEGMLREAGERLAGGAAQPSSKDKRESGKVVGLPR